MFWDLMEGQYYLIILLEYLVVSYPIVVLSIGNKRLQEGTFSIRKPQLNLDFLNPR